MATIPKNLSVYLKTINGYRRQLIRFYPDRSGPINSSDVLRWTLPKEIISIGTLTHFLDFTTSFYGSKTGPIYQGFYFGRNSSSIIDTLTVFINGQVYENINGYNHLFNIIYDNTLGINYYQSGLRALEAADPSVKYSIAANEVITATVTGQNTSSPTDPSDIGKPLQIRSWVGFLGSCKPAVLDCRNVEIIIEIRYAAPQIMFKGSDITATTTPTASYSINNYYMTVEKLTFDDDYYNLALDSLKNSGNYTIAFRTYNVARGSSVAKTSNPTLQFSTTAKYMSRLFLTFLDGNYNTISTIQNTSTFLPFAVQLASPFQYPDVFNQSIHFKKNGANLSDSQVEINGVPVFPYPQTLPQIKNNNIIALEQDNSLGSADFHGLYTLESWCKYAFLQAISFEHADAFKDESIISGYPNTQNTNLNIKWNTNFSSSATGNVFMYAFIEKFVLAKFNGNNVTIEM